jgi:penicillin-binding protein 1A
MGLLLTLLVVGIVAAIQWYFIPQMPPVERLKDVQMQVPLQIYSKDKVFIAEYGTQHRIPVDVENIPPLLIKAVIASEDERFYEHPGVDLKGLLRAAVSLFKTGQKRQGGSTITMQVARNFFLSQTRTFTRKFNEIALALKIDAELSKEEILKLYLNKIYLGHRAYGMGAAAQVYYGRDLDKLTLAEWAMLAGLPKAPSTNNPLINPERAIQRRNYVLGRMLTLNYITKEQYDTAINAPITAKHHKLIPEMDGLYFAEMARSFLLKKFGEEGIYKGYKVFLTIDSHLQEKAESALRRNLYRYDRRHGYKGPLDHVSIPPKMKASEVKEWAHNILLKYPVVSTLVPSLVLKVNSNSIIAYNRKVGQFRIPWSSIKWARRYITENRRGRFPRSARSVAKRGDIIMARYFIKRKKKTKNDKTLGYKVASKAAESQQAKFKRASWSLYQIPEVAGALASINPNDGSIIALAGGIDFHYSKFNRAIQAKRQPGSSFKPFIYSAAFSKGYTDRSRINDKKIVFYVGGGRWIPKNSSHKYYGWVTLRTALTYSFNVSAIRLLKQVGVPYTINHIAKFGFNKDKIPRNYTIALGTAEVTPLELATGFAVFANGGFRVKPYFIDRIEDMNGKIVYSANPFKVCHKCPEEILLSEKAIESNILVPHQACSLTPRYAPRVISTRNAAMMTSILKDVIRIGTGKKARRLRRSDIAGKTGTTNNQLDAWFAGYSPNIVTTVWVGFDRPRSLGHKEYGGNTALPMWANFMSWALKGKAIAPFPNPRGFNLTETRGSRLPRGYTSNRKKNRKKTTTTKRHRITKKKKRTVVKRKSKTKRRVRKKSTVIPAQLF